MATNQPIVQVETSGCFERQFRALFRSDVQPVIERLQAGEVLGDRLSGLNIVVFKMRVKNSDLQKGKSAGYRLIYQVETPTKIITIGSRDVESRIKQVGARVKRPGARREKENVRKILRLRCAYLNRSSLLSISA